MSNSSSETFGHCAICVDGSVQPYRRSVKPADCRTCQAYEAGKARAFAMAADTVHELYVDDESESAAVDVFYATIMANLVEQP